MAKAAALKRAAPAAKPERKLRVVKSTETRHGDKWINPRMNERVRKYEIPKPPYQPVYDRVLVYQIPTTEEETFKGSSIIKPGRVKDNEQRTAPRGVLVAAGLAARDQLESHGMRLGDIVWFARHSFWGHEVDAGDGRHKVFCFLRAAELVGSEDLQERLESKEAAIELGDDEMWRMADRPRVDVQGSPDDM